MLKKLDGYLSGLVSYLLIAGLGTTYFMLRPVSLYTYVNTYAPPFTDAPAIWWPIDSMPTNIMVGVACIALMVFHRAKWGHDWPLRHIGIAIVALLVTIAGLWFAGQSYVAIYPDRVDFRSTGYGTANTRSLPLSDVTEIAVSCKFDSLRGETYAQPDYVIHFRSGDTLSVFVGYSDTRSTAFIDALTEIDHGLIHDGVVRIPARENGPGTSDYRRCLSQMKTKLPETTFIKLATMLTPTASQSSYLRTLSR